MSSAISTSYERLFGTGRVSIGAPEAEGRVAIIGPMGFEQLPDEELVTRYRVAADPHERDQFINELFRRNYVRVARWCLRFTTDRETAADLAQEILTKVYQNLNSFQGQSKFSTWLFSIARNHCLNAVRASAK